MDVVKISLEALLQRATNPQNQNIDTAAVEAFCALMNKEKDGALTGIKLLASRIHSKQEQEVLQTLHIIDTSMQKCGSLFQSEVGKFRFLNEMIKLVSPKYLGAQTAQSVKEKVLQLMYLWTLDYPKETKIKEAYDMLKKQGVIKEVPLSVSAENYGPERKNFNVFQDDEKSKLLKKLLQSKNPEDLQAANRLIKTMVKEDEKIAELKSKRITELESIQNNVRLLNEMLDSYKPGLSSHDELDLINELHESCQRLKPNIVKLASETHQNDELGEILKANDELGQVFEKYTLIISKGVSKVSESSEISRQQSLLDLIENSASNVDLLQTAISTNESQSNLDVLCDIFTTPNHSDIVENDENILKPISVSHNKILDNGEKSNNKSRALEDLDALGENLLKENLQSSSRLGFQFNKPVEKVPMNNLLAKKTENQNVEKKNVVEDLNFDLVTLLEKPNVEQKIENEDDILVDIIEEKNVVEKEKSVEVKEVKLSDIFVDLNSIKPSGVKVDALEDRNGISVTLHFAKDKPRDDIIVVVVTIVSKNELPLKNVLFRAIVPKVCKVKLQTASATELPPYNPFLPAAAITQVMLIANPENVQVSLKFIVSYNMEDETLTEMGEIDCLPDTI